jgi:glycosyltransferase involved in cell wall biosynthesis
MHLDADITCTLWVNSNIDANEGSAFNALDSQRIIVQPVESGLPTDPWAPRSLAARLRFRGAHGARWFQLLYRAVKLKPDVIYTSQQRFDCFLGEMAARLLRRPHVVHLHFTPGPELRPRTLKRLRTCDQVIAVSSFIADRAVAHKVRPERILVLPNTLGFALPSLGNREHRQDGVLVIGQTGRMEENKGFADSVAAFALVHARGHAVELVLVGDGKDRGRVEALASELGVRDSVRFTGWQRDALSFLREFDVFIHPSRDEPFGLAVLEASGIGLPVVAYDDGGVPEIITDGETGLLTPVGDVDALASALEKMLSDPALRTRMGTAGQERVRSVFRADQAGRRFSSALHALVGGRSRRT